MQSLSDVGNLERLTRCARATPHQSGWVTKMSTVSRRDFVCISVGAVASLSDPAPVLAQTQCSSPYLPAAFVPTILTVDCASRRNFQLFRQYSDYLGLAGAVSMSFVRGKFGSFPAGNLFLFPWLKPNGQGRVLPAVMPTNATQLINSSPIPNSLLPLDEYFIRYIVQAPSTSFIGFLVDVPYTGDDTRRDWFSNVDQPIRRIPAVHVGHDTPLKKRRSSDRAPSQSPH